MKSTPPGPLMQHEDRSRDSHSHITVETEPQGQILAPPPFQLQAGPEMAVEEEIVAEPVQMMEADSFGAAQPPEDAGSDGSADAGDSPTQLKEIVLQRVESEELNMDVLKGTAGSALWAIFEREVAAMGTEFEFKTTLYNIRDEISKVLAKEVTQMMKPGIAAIRYYLGPVLPALGWIREVIERVPESLQSVLVYMAGWTVKKLTFGYIPDTWLDNLLASSVSLPFIIGKIIDLAERPETVVTTTIMDSMSLAGSAISAWWYGETDTATDSTGEKRTPRLLDADMGFAWLNVDQPELGRWTEEEDETTHAGLKLKAGLHLKLGKQIIGSDDFEFRLAYDGSWTAGATDVSLLSDPVSFFELFGLKKLSIPKIQAKSGEGLTDLQLKVEGLDFGGGVVHSEETELKYKKGSPIQFKGDAHVDLFGTPIDGGFDLAMTVDGALQKAAVNAEMAEISILGDLLQIKKPTAKGLWQEGKLQQLDVAAKLLKVALPGTAIYASEAKFQYDATGGFLAAVTQMKGRIQLGTATYLEVVLDNAAISRAGFKADSMTLTVAHGIEQAIPEDEADRVEGMDDSEKLKALVPGFTPDLIKKVGGLEKLLLTLRTTFISYDFGGGDEAKVKKQSEGSEDSESETPESTTTLTLEELDATAFGVHLTGKYDKKKSVFAGTFSSKHFGDGTYSVNTSDPEHWVASATDFALVNSPKSLFGVFGVGEVMLNSIEYRSGEGLKNLKITVKDLHFGDADDPVFAIGEIVTDKKGKALTVQGSNARFKAFGHEIKCGFGLSIDESGALSTISARAKLVAPLTLFNGSLTLSDIAGSAAWKQGKLDDMSLFGSVNMRLPGGVEIDAENILLHYEGKAGIQASVEHAQAKLQVSDKLQLLLEMFNGKLSKTGKVVRFLATGLSGTLSYGHDIFSASEGERKGEAGKLLPGLPTDWLDFAGLKGIVFRASADKVGYDETGFKKATWKKEMLYLEAKMLGMEVGYDAGQRDEARERMGHVDPMSGLFDAPESETDGTDSRRDDSESSESDTATPKKAVDGPHGWFSGGVSKAVSMPEISIDVMVFPGLSVGGAINASLSLGATLNGGLKKTAEGDTEDRYAITGGALLEGKGTLKADLHAKLGTRLLAAIQAGLYAKAVINAKARGALTGHLLWHKETNKLRVDPEKKPEIAVDLSTHLTASIGAEIRAKYLFFFDKELWSYEFKKWELGGWKLEGKFTSGDDGHYHFHRNTDSKGFDGADGKPTTKPLVAKSLATADEVLDKESKIEDMFMARRLLHDIWDPASGFSSAQQMDLTVKLSTIYTDNLSALIVNDPDSVQMLEEMERRTDKSSPAYSLLMTLPEWEAYSSTKKSRLLREDTITERRTVKAIDEKLKVYHSASGTDGKLAVLEGTIGDSDWAAAAKKIKMDDPMATESRPFWEKAGLIQLCELYLGQKRVGHSRHDAVAKLQNDALAEVDRLRNPPKAESPPVA